jgi:hypothetical protein
MVLFSAVLFLHLVQADTRLIDVKVRHDRKFDFSQLDNNFQWITRKDSSRNYVASVDPDINEYFVSVVNRTLAEKGYQQVFDGSASYGIDYVVIIEKEGHEDSLAKTLADLKQSRLSKTHIAGLPNIELMKAGTIILNIVNRETGLLIWIGYADAVVVEKKNREELIDLAVAKMLAEFPPK